MECYTPEPRGEMEEDIDLNLPEEVDLHLPEEEFLFVDPLDCPSLPPAQDGDVEGSSMKTSLLASTSSLTHSSSAPAETSNGVGLTCTQRKRGLRTWLKCTKLNL